MERIIGQKGSKAYTECQSIMCGLAIVGAISTLISSGAYLGLRHLGASRKLSAAILIPGTLLTAFSLSTCLVCYASAQAIGSIQWFNPHG